jgi:hypothetical protein
MKPSIQIIVSGASSRIASANFSAKSIICLEESTKIRLVPSKIT